MFKQRLKLGFLVVLVALAGQTVHGRAGDRVQVPVVGLVEKEELDALQRATVQLVLFGPAAAVEVDGPEAVRTTFGQTGLGTLVVFGKNTYLLTHDHWRDLEGVVRVQVLTFEGDLLVEVDGETFRRWVLFQDGGTLVLALPGVVGQLQGGQPAELGPAEAVQPGDVVFVAHQDQYDPGRVEFLPARVVSLVEEAGLQALKLRILTGEPVVRGDSGGGVWLDGQLVGNNWKTDVLVVWGLALLTDGPTPERPQDTNLAAAVPAQLLEALANLQNLTKETDGDLLDKCLVEEVC